MIILKTKNYAINTLTRTDKTECVKTAKINFDKKSKEFKKLSSAKNFTDLEIAMLNLQAIKQIMVTDTIHSSNVISELLFALRNNILVIEN